MNIKDTIAYCLVISLGLILAIHFVLFWLYGGVFIYEDNKTILLLETIMSVAIFGFGIERFASSATSGPKARSSFSLPRPMLARTGSESTTSPLLIAGPRMATSGNTAATSVTATLGQLLSSAAPTAENCTIHMSDQSEQGGVILAHLTHTEHEPTMDTSDVCSLALDL